MIDRRLVSGFSWWLFLLVLGISILGVFIIYSANHGRPEEFFRTLYVKQIYWIIYGLGVMAFVAAVDYSWLNRYAYVIYALTLAALAGVLLFGTVASGARRWLQIGPLHLQVSEFAKYSLIIFLAKYFEAGKPQGEYRLRDFIVPGAFTAILALLVAVQPDLGTALMILFIYLVFVFAVEINRKTLLRLAFSGVLLAPTLWLFLKDYQKQRLLTLFNPELDPLGAGYHAIQSKIAIGSGGFWGKGLLAGTQSRLNFLPEKHTDFIFSVYAEEMGFIGALVLLMLYLALVLKGFWIAQRARDRFGLFIGLGATCVLLFYIVYNIGMTLGMFPITGVPLPFLSYGGSSLVANFIGVGLLLNIEMRRTIR